jgi:hypothetical protein
LLWKNKEYFDHNFVLRSGEEVSTEKENKEKEKESILFLALRTNNAYLLCPE